jgi:hypothetical protein
MPERCRSRWLWRVALCAWVLLAAPAPAVADDTPPPAAPPQPALAVPLHEALYHATVRRIPVRAGLRLEQQSDGLYVYRSWVEPRGLLGFVRRELTETSLVRLEHGAELTPLSYVKRDGFSDRDSDMRFDPLTGQVHIRFRGREQAVDWEPGVYDLLSLRLVLAHDLARGALKDVYRVVDDRGRVETVDVELTGPERLSTALGEIDTVRLEYHSSRKDRLYRLWIAPGMDSALVRIEQHEEGQLRGALSIVEYRRL